MWGIQIVRVQSDNGGEFINEQLISGCRLRGIHLSQTPPYKPQSSGLIERMVGIVKEHMRNVLHGAYINEQYWPDAA
eukprot:6455489-Prorocentrum_lima.AAC.1